MKKIALVAALAATAAAPAFAQSVTLWGRINTSVESQKFGTQDRKIVVQNNSSRLGFKGSEDLGGGLKASFSLEHGLNSDTGAATGGTTFWNRASWVQLEGSFGGVRLGKWFPGSYFATADYVSMHNHDTGTSSDALYATQFYTNNKVSYFTPTVAGFSAELSVAAGENTTTRAEDIAVNYDVGPFHAGLGYEKKGDFTQVAVRGLYEIGPVVIGGYIQRAENSFGAAGKKDWNVWRLSGMYVMGQSEFHLNFGKADQIIADDGAKQLTVGYNYNLSKRTKIYGFWTKVDNQTKGTYFTGAAGQDFSSLAAGIRHNF
ncbi:putative porin [Pelomonas saccharophila]|uniref:Porin n=1 Tax=Roseateles saccharophilus TaxID=304 RepID=A0ABU1YW51_ROSSA|nr:porin [Roseateles saccharophilus]MDR7273104.1 putative porin [Roseateles saccharophilus]